MFHQYTSVTALISQNGSDLSSLAKANKPSSIFARIGEIPGFFCDGFSHIRNVGSIFPLALWKLFFVMVTFAFSLGSLGCLYFLNEKFGLLSEATAHFESGPASDEGFNIVMNSILILFGGSYLIVMALINGVFNGAMGAATFLSRSRQDPSITNALKIALQHATRLWAFKMVHILVMLLTLSSKRDGFISRAMNSVIRAVWKIATIGLMPALINGRTLTEAMQRSIDFIKHEPAKIMALHFTYGFLLWVLILVGIPPIYLVGGGNFITMAFLFFGVYFVVVSVVLRPIYITMIYYLYAEFLEKTNGRVEVDSQKPPSKFFWVIIYIYTFITLIPYLFGILYL